MKRAVFILLSVVFTFGTLCVNAFAERFESGAAALNNLGLFYGTGEVDWEGNPDFELYRGATRAEAIVMLIRLLGEEEVAKNCLESHPFTDVPEGNWAYPYVAYAYTKGYAAGMTDTEFCPRQEVSVNMFITFLLRALGYSDKDGDFRYDMAIPKGAETGLLIDGTYIDGNVVFMRGDCAYTSLRALNTTMKNGTILAENLAAKGVIDLSVWQQVSQAIQDEDVFVNNSFLLDTAVRPDTPFSEGWHHVYSEYDSNNRKIRTIGDVYYNPWQKISKDYIYDDNGYLIVTQNHSGVVGPTFTEYAYENNRIHVYNYYGLYENGDYDEVEDYDDIEYNPSTGIAEITIEGNSFYLPDIPGVKINKVLVYDKKRDLIYTAYINDNGDMTELYDKKDRPLDINEYDTNNRLIKCTSYTYKWVSDSPLFDAASGEDSVSIIEYLYNGDRLSAVKYEDGAFTFTYLGNGKLDRVYWKDEEGTTWLQTYVDYDENGHVRVVKDME